MSEDKPVAKGEPKAPTPVEEKVGTHPLGAAAGAIGGAVAGTVVGIAAGPLGSLAGAIGGAVAGGMLGASTGVGPVVDLSAEERWWREHYASRPYVAEGMAYEDYEPAYQYAMRRYVQSDHPREWSEVQGEMGSGWDAVRGASRLTWEQAQDAARDAWDRMRTPH